MPQSPLTVDVIEPMLMPSGTSDTPLSTVAFDSATATINLSDTAAMTLAVQTDCRTQGDKDKDEYTFLNHKCLAESGLDLRKVWDDVAEKLINDELTPYGICFLSRSATALLGAIAADGIQVRTEHHLIASWMAHPRTFSILDKHLKRELGTELVFYFVPSPHTVFAFPESALPIVDFLHDAIDDLYADPDDMLFQKPLVWSNGFPLSFTTSPGRKVA